MPNPLTQADLRWLVCPVCRGALRLLDSPPAPSAIACTNCNRHFPVQDGLPILLAHRATFPA